MEENQLDEEDLEDDGMMLSEDDILQVIELGDEQPMNGNASISLAFIAQILQLCLLWISAPLLL